jgi:carbonic anhydrase
MTTKETNMKKLNLICLTLIVSVFVIGCVEKEEKSRIGQTDSNNKFGSVSINTADESINELKEGNNRFLRGKLRNTNYKRQIELTKLNQHPHSVILSCIDSRIPPEIIFDQGIGNILVVRSAANIEDPNVLGSLELATKGIGVKSIVVMGHTHCGAVKRSFDKTELGGYTTQLINQIKPAIIQSEDKEAMLDMTSRNNVKITISDIVIQSSLIKCLVKENKIKIVGAYYDIWTGKVAFFDYENDELLCALY